MYEADKENMIQYSLSCGSTVQVWHSNWCNASTSISRQRTVQIKLLFYVTKEHPVYMRTKTRKSEFIAHMFHLQFSLSSMQAVFLSSFS